MKRILALAFLLVFSLSISAQVKVELQLGGVNFLGATLNTEIDIPIHKEKGHYLMPRIGIGSLVPGIYSPSAILNVGLHYRINKISFGCEVAGFAPSPFFGTETPFRGGEDFIDMLVYPNLNYTFTIRKTSPWYLRVSAGAYIAYARDYNFSNNSSDMTFQGDIIPGAGLSIGYKF